MCYVPQWLEAIMSDSDRAIIEHPKALFLAEDPEGNRLPNHQQWIESPAGSMWIDSQKKAILGYGPAVAKPTAARSWTQVNVR